MKRACASGTFGKRAARYLRVSSEEQLARYSPDAQERVTRVYCEAHGWEIARAYRDEGRSARTDDLAKRAAFQQLLADGEARLIDVIVVHKLDRFARNRRVAVDAFRLGTADVGFVSVAENIDYSTPVGLLMLTMLVGLRQFYSDNLSFETKKGKSERKRQGLYNGLLPFWIRKNRDGIPVPDPENYPAYCSRSGWPLRARVIARRRNR